LRPCYVPSCPAASRTTLSHPPLPLPAPPGIRGKALVINLPGKPKSIRETFDEVFKSIPYCIQLLEGPYIETHAAVVPAFRPPADRRTAPPAKEAA
jgi:molybdopterin adenylyltransferase